MILRLLAVVLALAGTSVASGNRYLIRTTPAAIDEVARTNGLRVIGNVDGASKQVYLVEGSAIASGPAVVSALKAHPAVANAEVDARVSLPEARLNQSTVAILDGGASVVAQQNNRFQAYLTQPATQIINLASAQRLATGAGIVAIIDTGVDAAHPVLKDSVIGGYDFIHNTAGVASDVADLDQSTVAILDQSTVAILDQSTVAILDQSTVAILDQSTVPILDGQMPASFGHGTMVAGLVHLVAPTASIMPLKAFSADGSANLSDIVRAVYYAADAGAAVINMSFSMDAPSQELTNALKYANSKQCMLVSSVANAASSADVYPAAFKKVFGVASTNNFDLRSSFSNYGSDVSIAAPGEALITTFPFGRYAVVWGTSFSTGLVSGTGALLEQVSPSLKHPQAANALSHAVPVQGQGLGWGRLDASWAVTAANGGTDEQDDTDN